MAKDPRLAAARDLLYLMDQLEPGRRLKTRQALTGLIDYAEERLRVNVGLLAENTQLKRDAAARQP